MKQKAKAFLKPNNRKKQLKKKNNNDNIIEILKLLNLESSDNNSGNIIQNDSLCNNNVLQAKNFKNDSHEVVNKEKENSDKFIKYNRENKSGLVEKKFFLQKIKDNTKYKKEDFFLQNVSGDGNCGYRCLALQLYGDEDEHGKIREKVYNYLDKNRDLYKQFNFEYNGNIVSSDEYINIIKDDNEWMGEIEIIATMNCFDANIMVFQKNDNDEIYLLNKYGNFENKEKILLTLCYVNDNHFNVIYEKQNVVNDSYSNTILKDISNINMNNNDYPQSGIKFKYANDIDKTNKYDEIENFVINNLTKGTLVYPEYINNISNKNKRHTKRVNFRRACQGYSFDFNLNRLTKIINISRDKKIMNNKTYYIPYEFEKKALIKTIHDQTMHKGINILHKLIKESKFWWHSIYKDISNYIIIKISPIY